MSVDLDNQLNLNLVIGELGTLLQLAVNGALLTLGIDLDDVALGLGTACLCLRQSSVILGCFDLTQDAL